jgi:KDO2-lipid IV(A) lauroyltransferase
MSLKYLGYRCAQWLSETLPSESAFRVAERLADLQWRSSAKDRQAVQANLSLVLGTPTPESSPLVRDVFRNFGRYLVEFFSIHRMQQPEVIVEGYDHLAKALEPHRGTIAMTGHVGNWEVAAVLLRRMGIPLSAIALPHDDPRMDRVFTQQRARCGVDTIPLGADAARRGVQRLRDGGLLGILGDREFFGHGLTVSLYGREVLFPRGPAVLSLRAQAPVVPTFLIREGPWKFRLCLEPPIWPTTTDGRLDRSIRRLTQMYADVLARYLRRFPDQWLMFQSVRG